MRWSVLILALGLMGSPVRAQEPPASLQPAQPALQAPSEPHVVSAGELSNRPSLQPIMLAAARSGVTSASTRIALIWDDTGKVTYLKLETPTGSEALDNAILGWAALLRLTPGQAGEGLLPFEINVD